MTDATESLMAKSRAAFDSARILFEAGDFDGAANRLYYALFDAARACLVLVDPEIAARAGKTHGGLIGAFGLHLVKNGPFPAEMGRFLNRTFELRQAADYADVPLDRSDVEPSFGEASDFLANAGAYVEGIVPRI